MKKMIKNSVIKEIMKAFKELSKMSKEWKIKQKWKNNYLSMEELINKMKIKSEEKSLKCMLNLLKLK